MRYGRPQTNLGGIDASGDPITILHAGLPFRSPASVDVGTFGTSTQAVVVRPDFVALFTGGMTMPNLAAVPPWNRDRQQRVGFA